MKLRLAAIREDPEVQLRGGLDMDRVAAMTEFVEQGGQLPPVTVVGDDNLIADGHHRLYVAETMGREDIEATRVPGDAADAVALAIQLNDIATSKPLSRTERNAGVKLLLRAGWTQERIAKVAGVHRSTIENILNALAMKGQLTKSGPSGNGHRTPKPVTVLPTAVHEKLNDTVLTRIADSVPFEQQLEFAEAVAEAGLSEPRVREAIAALRRNGKTPTEAVQSVTPVIRAMPVTLSDVAKQVRRRLEHFLSEPMTIEGAERDFWAVLAVLAANIGAIPLEAKGLAAIMADVAVRADYFASALTAEAIEA